MTGLIQDRSIPVNAFKHSAVANNKRQSNSKLRSKMSFADIAASAKAKPGGGDKGPATTKSQTGSTWSSLLKSKMGSSKMQSDAQDVKAGFHYDLINVVSQGVGQN